jgi:DNA topoisomerase-1
MRPRHCPRYREAVEGHLRDRGLTRQRVLATAVPLRDLGFFHIGSDRRTEPNASYGLNALLRRR